VLFLGDIVIFSVKLLGPGKTPFAGNVAYLSKNGNTTWDERLSAQRVSPKPPIAALPALNVEPPHHQAGALH